jgi:YfiH family protein
MSYEPVMFNEEVIGFSLELETHFFFFGTAAGEFTKIEARFPHFTFHHLRQVHGDALTECAPDPSSNPLPHADAHWATHALHAPVIQTADCLPVLVAHPKFTCAIHAGWRGVQNQIVLKSVRSLITKFGSQDTLHVGIGPHILKESFEVDLPLGQDLESLHRKTGGENSVLSLHPENSTKAHIDLVAMVYQQLRRVDVAPQQIHPFLVDTKSDSRFASFRRQKSAALRNYSFVTRLKD